MPTLEGLSKAVEEGIISAQQEKELVSFFQEQAVDTPSVARDEAPRFFRSFNDLFIGLGVAILGFALIMMAGLVPSAEKTIKFGLFLLFSGVFWLLAEWITLKRRINFPSIILAIFFGYFFFTAMKWGWEAFFLSEQSTGFNSKDMPYGIFIVSALSSVAMAVFFERFRLPFSILLLAGGLVFTALTALICLFGSDVHEPFLRWIFLAAGLSIFAGAMYFDMQDPLRTQRTSDHGFWLHLLAAPIITHSVLWTTLQPLVTSSPNAEPVADLMLLIVLAMFVVFSLIALIIDRRALLISSLGYAATALGYILYKFNIEGSIVLILTLILISILILSLGTGWYTLRALVFKVLPDFDFYKKLPPLVTTNNG